MLEQGSIRGLSCWDHRSGALRCACEPFGAMSCWKTYRRASGSVSPTAQDRSTKQRTVLVAQLVASHGALQGHAPAGNADRRDGAPRGAPTRRGPQAQSRPPVAFAYCCLRARSGSTLLRTQHTKNSRERCSTRASVPPSAPPKPCRSRPHFGFLSYSRRLILFFVTYGDVITS